jgi:hypothetical protein
MPQICLFSHIFRDVFARLLYFYKITLFLDSCNYFFVNSLDLKVPCHLPFLLLLTKHQLFSIQYQCKVPFSTCGYFVFQMTWGPFTNKT